MKGRDMERFRKAVVAGVLAWLGAIVTAAVEGGTPTTTEGWVSLVLGAAGVGVLAGVATYKVRNTGPGINRYGSETPAASGLAGVVDRYPARFTPGRSGGYPAPAPGPDGLPRVAHRPDGDRDV